MKIADLINTEELLKNQSVLDILLLALGHRDDLSGTEYLRDAVLLYADGYTQITKELYPEVAKIYGTKPTSVERCIRHSIEQAAIASGGDAWGKVFGNSIDPNKGRPTNGAYIARLARLVRLNED